MLHVGEKLIELYIQSLQEYWDAMFVSVGAKYQGPGSRDLGRWSTDETRYPVNVKNYAPNVLLRKWGLNTVVYPDSCRGIGRLTR